MTYRPLIAASLIALGMSLPATAAVDCANFTDVTTADSFCPAVEWLKNRSVTSGCTATEYCPLLNVTRAQMALFMNRLGKALTPVVLHKEALVANLTVPAGEPGALMCATGDYAVTGFPRTARFIGTFFGTPSSGPSWIQGYWKYSADNGSTWTNVPNAMIQRDWANYGEVAGATVLAPPMALAPGSTYRFGLFLNGMGGTYPFHAMVCQLDVTIDNSNPATSPLDE